METLGGYGEPIVLSEPLLIEVPEHVPTEVAALTEPLAVAYRTVARAELGPGDVPLVLGCGPIGPAVITVLPMRGDAPIVAADFSAERRELARRLGADVVVDPAVASPYQAWERAAATDDPGPDGCAHDRDRPAADAPHHGVRVRRGAQDHLPLIAGSPAGSRIVVAGLCMTADAFEPAQAILKKIDLRFALITAPWSSPRASPTSRRVSWRWRR